MAVFLFFYLYLCRRGTASGYYYIDSSKLPVCHNLRIHSNKVFKGIAKRGKTSTGWFFGLKLHIIINEQGQLMAFSITPGNVSDNNKKIIQQLCRQIFGKLFGDKGYINQPLADELLKNGLLLITKRKKNMKNCLMEMRDKIMLSKRGIIESAIELMKHICNIDHTRHRSPMNAIINIFAGIAAYSHMDKLPHVKLNEFRLREYLPIAA